MIPSGSHARPLSNQFDLVSSRVKISFVSCRIVNSRYLAVIVTQNDNDNNNNDDNKNHDNRIFI